MIPVLIKCIGSFALWGCVFSTTDCMLLAVRKKEDGANPIISGFFTGGCLAFRGGYMSALKNAFIGGAILGLMEGANLLISTMQYREQKRQLEEMKKLKQEEAMITQQRRERQAQGEIDLGVKTQLK